ncbi:MAG TPA: hypothetical protein VOA41_13865 [Candidatus Dormibacteraeota bacterium]|nr:hypothetical protein [Candidatus Dormibacteraeota bacterium]
MNFRLLVLALCAAPWLAYGQQKPYFVTYDHHMEEPGSLEVSINPVIGKPRGGDAFIASWVEFEYGTKGWWTTELYLEGQSTRNDSTLFTGWRLENRFHPLKRQHWINPVLYVEFADLNAAKKTLQEVVGFDSQEDQAVPNALARAERLHEVEAKLILGSDFKGWSISENFIAEKNLSNVPWEFGYALGASRPLTLAAIAGECNLCRENFRAGVELYGGLGDWHRFTLRNTSQYLAPVLSWELPNGTSFRISPTIGLTDSSHRFLLRFGISYEFSGFGHRVRRWFK